MSSTIVEILLLFNSTFIILLTISVEVSIAILFILLIEFFFSILISSSTV